jgi:hypothetical protein
MSGQVFTTINAQAQAHYWVRTLVRTSVRSKHCTGTSIVVVEKCTDKCSLQTNAQAQACAVGPVLSHRAGELNSVVYNSM